MSESCEMRMCFRQVCKGLEHSQLSSLLIVDLHDFLMLEPFWFCNLEIMGLLMLLSTFGYSLLLFPSYVSFRGMN